MKSSRTATEGKLLQDYEKLKNEAKEKMQETEKTIENIKSEIDQKNTADVTDKTAKTELWITDSEAEETPTVVPISRMLHVLNPVFTFWNFCSSVYFCTNQIYFYSLRNPGYYCKQESTDTFKESWIY